MAALIDSILEDRPSWLSQYDPHHPTAFTDFVEKLKAARRNNDRTLRAGYPLLSSIELRVPEITLTNEESRRDLPAYLKAGCLHSIELHERLGRERENTPSQVWRAKVVSATGEVCGTVVAKIYHPFFSVPEKNYIAGVYEYATPQQRARIEEAAYETLASAQGTWVPYFLGRFQTELYGETAEVNLVEYVPHKTLSEWGKDQAKTKEDHSVGSSDFQALHKEHAQMLGKILPTIENMHALGVMHCDLHGFNVILPDPEQSSYQGVVFIGFEFARTYKTLDNSNPGAIDMYESVHGFLCCHEHAMELLEWCENNGKSTDWDSEWTAFRFC